MKTTMKKLQNVAFCMKILLFSFSGGKKIFHEDTEFMYNMENL